MLKLRCVCVCMREIERERERERERKKEGEVPADVGVTSFLQMESHIITSVNPILKEMDYDNKFDIFLLLTLKAY